jgi:hypothetical protein
MTVHLLRMDAEVPLTGKPVRLQVVRVAEEYVNVDFTFNDPMDRVSVMHRKPKDAAKPPFIATKWYELRRVEQTNNGWTYPIVGFFVYPGELTRYVDTLIQRYGLDQEKPHERV